MKAKLIKCGICFSWYSPKVRNHCDVCGAYHSYIMNMHVFCNRNDITMARGIPIELDSIIDRVVRKSL